jgi:hypothetical protein
MTMQLPDREALRAHYDAAVTELNQSRNNILNTDFYRKTGDAVFDAGCLALSDTASNTRRMHTVSAPAGGGKTTFAFAFIVALTRYADSNPDAPYGAVFVVDQIEKADSVYRELNALLPGKVAVWTKDHDKQCKQPEKVATPAAKFDPEELRRFPVAVVTHQFYLGTRGHNATGVMRNARFAQRALTVVDERPDEAPSLEVTLSEAQAVREALIEDHPETKEHLDALLLFMEPYSYAPANEFFRPGLELDADTVASQLGWFKSDTAKQIAKSVGGPSVEKLFAFAKALSVGRACVATSGARAYFFGYEEQRIIDRSAGTILLDATADIDGVSSIVPWRAQVEIPKATYENLQIIHVPQHTKKRLSEYLKTAANQRAYMKWVVATIKENMAPGEKGLVICKKALFAAERIPQWPEGDPRFKEPKSFTERYEWDVDGRKLCATHWGTGVGSNAWRDADAVFLFDEFFIPKRIAVATTQGLRGHKVHEGDLGGMKNLNAKAPAVDMIAEGHALRWTKQLALRGRARFYDEHGVCGKQRLIVGSDLKRFLANADRLFPGAKIRTVGDHGEDATWTVRVLEALTKTQGQVLTSKDLAGIIKRPWREVSRNVLTQEFLSISKAQGWRYVSKKGRGGARFERVGAQWGEGMPKGALAA